MSTALLQKLFPIEGITIAQHGKEVNGLPENTEPQNCEILGKGSEKMLSFPNDRRDYYLVKCGDELAFFRICTAAPGSGYAEFVVLHRVVNEVESPQRANDLKDYAFTIINAKAQ